MPTQLSGHSRIAREPPDARSRWAIEKRARRRSSDGSEYGDSQGRCCLPHPLVIGDQHAEVGAERCGAGDVDRVETAQRRWLQAACGSDDRVAEWNSRDAGQDQYHAVRGSSGCEDRSRHLNMSYHARRKGPAPGLDRLTQRRRFGLDDHELDECRRVKISDAKRRRRVSHRGRCHYCAAAQACRSPQ